MDKSWMKKNRLSKEYELGIETFLAFGLNHANGSNSILCPCLKCGNHISNEVATVRHHLYANGIDQSYTVWFWHGEKFEPKNSRNNLVDEEVDDNDLFNTINMVEAAYDEYSNPGIMFDTMFEDAKKPLYPGCKKFTKLSALVRLYNMKVRFGWSNTSFSEILTYISDLLPQNNEMPVSMYEAKKTLGALGLSYQKIDACPNDCCLYRKEYEHLNECPICNLSRWKMRKNCLEVKRGVPAKQLWYFPIIPRLIRMYKSVEHAKNLVWHAINRKVDGVMRHPADSPAWRLLDHLWPSFGAEHRNLRFGLSTDGVNPYGDLSTKYSCWPVILTIYNLPPWLCMRKKFLMLTMLVSGPKQPGYNIDVYLAPLIDDLKLMWEEGVQCFDAYKEETFTLRAVLMWTINDFPAYGNLCGCTVKGYKACPICGEKTTSLRLKHSKRIVYMGHRKYMSRHHPYRRQKKSFDGFQEYGTVPVPMSGQAIAMKLNDMDFPREKKGDKKLKDKTVNNYWKRKSVFFELPYWKNLHMRHCLDVMHIEKNVCMNIIGTLLDIPGKSKDGINTRLDLLDMNIRHELAPQTRGNRTYIPPACYTLSKAEKYTFCKTLANIKVPEGYSSNIRNLVSLPDLKLNSLKSHDCHVLMQQLLPVALRAALPKNVRYAISGLCFFFNAICSKSIRVSDLDKLQDDVVVTLCQLEKYFPPSFFTIMMHLTSHLVREVKLCGPVYLRWMYPFDRYMKVLKSFVRNRNRPEGSIVEAYICEEAVEFCSEFLNDLDPVGLGTFQKHEENKLDRPLSAGSFVIPNTQQLKEAHLYILNNTNGLQPYREQFMEHLKGVHPRRSKNEKWLLEEHNRSFPSWLRYEVLREIQEGKDISNVVRWLAHGPNPALMKYEAFKCNGYSYNTKSRDDKRVVQNSGVMLIATTMQVSSAKDKNPVVGDMSFYGVITEIWEVSYNTFKTFLFKCDWVESHNGVKIDDLGFTLVDLNRIGHVSDSFILATQAKQVFYVKDPCDERWSIVITPPQRYIVDACSDDELGDISLHCPSVSRWKHAPDTDDKDTTYTRDDCEGTWVTHN